MKRLKELFKRLVPLNRNRTSPRVFLEEMLENCDHFKSVMVVIQYTDETMDCDWSEMEPREVAMACIVLDAHLRRCVVDRGHP